MIFVVFSENDKGFCTTELATETFDDAIAKLKENSTDCFLEVCEDEDVFATITLDSETNEFFLELDEEDFTYNSLEELKSKVKTLFNN